MASYDELQLLRAIEAWEAKGPDQLETGVLASQLGWTMQKTRAALGLAEKRGHVRSYRVISTDPPERSEYVEITGDGLAALDAAAATAIARTGSLGFAIMQIGNEELDGIWSNVYVPALKNTGLSPRRVDRHNEGGLLKSEILGFIRNARILLADLTNERPNVYLEVGVALGYDKAKSLILTCREDHKPDRPGRAPKDPKVHFDLAGYDIIYWNPDDLDGFRTRLETKIRRRLSLPDSPHDENAPAVLPREPAPIVPNATWLQKQRGEAATLFARKLTRSYVEVILKPEPARVVGSNQVLIRAAKAAISTKDSWPIGLFETGQELKAGPDGISHTIDFDPVSDHWALHKDGTFYCAENLFELKHTAKSLNIVTRLDRIIEAILYADRLYDELQYDPTTRILLTVDHCGLRGLLPANDRMTLRGATAATTDETAWATTIPLEHLRNEALALTQQAGEDLLASFGLGLHGLDAATYKAILEPILQSEQQANDARLSALRVRKV